MLLLLLLHEELHGLLQVVVLGEQLLQDLVHKEEQNNARSHYKCYTLL
jgi:hypothetical protein